ncbi:hypothetical protein RRG08_002479 [Elysia crispata]|uniref:Uncharacterized protein n=1 Tax=Elysia crispata TaxID=231223 RepID=A0AAE1DTY5_9GAST|nr:hypothetical protein RRG08_002479 [Elysia crispata]
MGGQIRSRRKQHKPGRRFQIPQIVFLPLVMVRRPAHHTHRPSVLLLNVLFLSPVSTIMSEENISNGIMWSTLEDIHTPGPVSDMENTTKDLSAVNRSLHVKKCPTGGPKSNLG